MSRSDRSPALRPMSSGLGFLHPRQKLTETFSKTPSRVRTLSNWSMVSFLISECFAELVIPPFLTRIGPHSAGDGPGGGADPGPEGDGASRHEHRTADEGQPGRSGDGDRRTGCDGGGRANRTAAHRTPGTSLDDGGLGFSQ